MERLIHEDMLVGESSDFVGPLVSFNSFPLGELKETTGTPRTTWTKTTQQNLESLNPSLNEAVDVAQNRPLWRMMSVWRNALIVVHARNE